VGKALFEFIKLFCVPPETVTKLLPTLKVENFFQLLKKIFDSFLSISLSKMKILHAMG